jgi:OOP family OmpA-OmpF porin
MKINNALVGLALFLLSASAGAQSGAFTYFVGGSLGQSDVDESLVSGLITSGSIDGKDTALKIYGGGFFGKHLGAELAYVDLGEASYSGTFFGTSVNDGRASVWGYNVAAVARLPVSPQFEVFGKLGVFLWENEVSDVFGGTPTSNTIRGWDGGSFGIGAAWRFTRHLAARLEWERFPIDVSDASLLSLGVQYNF